MKPIDLVCMCSIGAAFEEERVLRWDGDDPWWNRVSLSYSHPDWDHRLDVS